MSEQLKTMVVKHSKWSEELTRENLDVWDDAVSFFNRVCLIMSFAEKGLALDLEEKIKASAMSTVNNIAKGNKVDTRSEYQDYLLDAIDSVQKTVALLYVLKEKASVQNDLFDDIFYKGKFLVRDIQRLCSSI